MAPVLLAPPRLQLLDAYTGASLHRRPTDESFL